MTLDEARLRLAAGQTRVVYQAEGGPPEEGVITLVTDRYVFVRYGADAGSKATRAEFLAGGG